MRSRPTLGCSLAIVATLSQAPQAAASPPPPTLVQPGDAASSPASTSLDRPTTKPAAKPRATRAEIGFGVAATLLGTGSALMLVGGAFGIAMPLVAERSRRERHATQELLFYCGSNQHPQQCEGIELGPLNERVKSTVHNELLASQLDPQVGLGMAIAGFVLVVSGAAVFAGLTRQRLDKRVSVLPAWGPRGGGLVLEGRF